MDKQELKKKCDDLINKIMDLTPVDYPLNCTGEQANKIALEDMELCKKLAIICIQNEYNSIRKAIINVKSIFCINSIDSFKYDLYSELFEKIIKEENELKEFIKNEY